MTEKKTRDLLKELISELEDEDMPKLAEANKGTGNAFLLNDDELASLVTARGRKATDSVYLTEMKEAQAHPGDVYGIKLSDTLTDVWVSSQLRKAAKQLEMDSKQFTIYNRKEKGFIAYVVAKPAEVAEAEAASE